MLYIDAMRTLYDFTNKALEKYKAGDHTALIKRARRTTHYLPSHAIILTRVHHIDERDAMYKRIHRDFPHNEIVFTYTDNKHIFCQSPEDILITDWKEEGYQWQKAGGCFYKFINKYNSIDKKQRCVKFRESKNFFEIYNVLEPELNYLFFRKERRK